MIRTAITPLSAGPKALLRPTVLAARHASSAPSPSAPPSSSTASSTPLPLSWKDYFALRRQRKMYSTVATVPSTLGGLTLGGGYFASLELDPSQLIMGIDPMFVYGGATMACMGLGYVLGPTFGHALFSLTHPSVSRGNPAPLEVMDREFFERIAKRRGDPSYQSVNNPAPDFYGEKIVSLPTYRRWLRDQAAYNRKARHGVPEDE